MIINLMTVILLVIGSGFFIVGTLGVLRFRSALNRLHAVTKADNLGIGLVVLGLMLQASTIALALKLLLIWLLVLISSATVSHLIGQRARQADKESAL